MNEDLKTRFVRESYLEREWISYESAFRRFNPYEAKFERPLHQFDVAQLQEAVDATLGNSTTQWTKVDAIRRYICWCKKNGMEDVQDSAFHLDESSLEDFKFTTVSGPLQLQAWLNEVFSPEFMQTADNVHRGYIWLGFSGFSDSNLGDLLRSDVDFENRVIRFGGDTFPIYRDAIPTFTNLVSRNSFIMTRRGIVYDLPRATGDKLLSGVGGQEFQHRNIRAYVAQKTVKAINEGRTRRRINYRNAALSGLFYRLYSAESKITAQTPAVSTVDIALYELARFETQQVEYKPLSQVLDTVEYYTEARYKTYKEQYVKWKTVFYT